MKADRPLRRRRAEEVLEAARGAGYFASVTLRLPSIEPEAVLASPPVGVRGFWQSGPHWIAHAGAAAEIDSREGVPEPPPEGLIAWMRERAGRLFSEPWVLDLDGEARRPRMHGGFAFDPRTGRIGSRASGRRSRARASCCPPTKSRRTDVARG